MSRTAQQYARILDGVMQGATSKDLGDRTRVFLSFLRKAQALKKLSAILSAFETHCKEAEGVVTGTAVFAREFSAAQKKKILEHSGMRLEAETQVDPAIIAGCIIKTKSVILDASAKTQLERLGQYLERN